ncbi:MAG: hypothetical protein V3W34_12190 [Phycisphaerae bacterium]
MNGAACRSIAEPVVLASRCQAEVLPQVDWQIACESCPLEAENAELRQQRGYYKSMHQRACQREQELKRENEKLRAEVRQWKRQLFGRKSEKCHAGGKPLAGQIASKPPKRPKGQQPGSEGHGRRDHSHLPAVDEVHDFPEQDCQYGIWPKLRVRGWHCSASAPQPGRRLRETAGSVGATTSGKSACI